MSMPGREPLDTIRDRSRTAEEMKDLHPDQLDVIRREKWLTMFIPKSCGGLGLTLPEVLRAEEALSAADGSTAWFVTLCAGAGWFVGFVDPDIADEFFRGDNICIAGSGAISGVAEATGSGFTVNGTWKYATGSLHATAFTANCYLRKDGRPLLNEDGSPKFGSFIFRRAEAEVLDTWRSMGMIATASHSFEVRNKMVPSSRCFHIDPALAVLRDPVYQYPFLQLAEATLSVNMSGMASRFVDLAEEIIGARSPRQGITATRESLDSSRKKFFEVVDGSWSSLLSEKIISGDLLIRVSEASHDLVQTCRDVVNTLYPRCGLHAANLENEINRVWRNFNTAGQHALFGST